MPNRQPEHKLSGIVAASDVLKNDDAMKSAATLFRCQLALAGAALLAAGCTMIPSYTRPTAPVTAQFPGVAATNEARSASLPWRNFFADERLEHLLDLALTNNRDMRVAVLNVAESRAEYRVTRSSLFPTVDAGGSYTRSHASGVTSSSWSANLGTTSWELDLFGRVRSLNRQALEKYFATDEARRSEQVSLVSEVATEYFTLREAEELLALSQHTLQSVQESYDVNKAMFDAGATSELDVREAEGEVQSAKISVTTYQRQKAQAENYLTLLIGSPLPTNLPTPRNFTDTNLLADIPAGLPSELLQQRPDILEAEHTLKADNANVGAARAAFFPTISLTASAGSTSAQLSKLFGSGTGVWSFAPQVTVPIFTGGQNMADLDAAKITKRIDVADYEKAIQTAFREVADALVGVNSYALQIDEETALVTAQQHRYDLATVRYRQGEDTYLNALTAQQDLFSAQQGLLQAQYNKLASQISLYQALGGGWN
jgi:multidrug efflux system outer membrane protein